MSFNYMRPLVYIRRGETAKRHNQKVFYLHSGVVFIVHGVGEHSGRYEHNGLGKFLKNNKYAVHSHDHG